MSIAIFQNRLVDVGTEWRSFSNEKSGSDPSRVGAPENPLLGSADLSTSIAVGFGASESDHGYFIIFNAGAEAMPNAHFTLFIISAIKVVIM